MPSRVVQFAVVTAHPSLGMWSFTTSRAGGGHKIFDLTNVASHVCPPGELVSCVISMSSPNFHTNSLYFNHSSSYKLLHYAWVTCDYISRKISLRNWFQCFPVNARCCSGSGSGSISASVSGFRILDFRVFHAPVCRWCERRFKDKVAY